MGTCRNGGDFDTTAGRPSSTSCILIDLGGIAFLPVGYLRSGVHVWTPREAVTRGAVPATFRWVLWCISPRCVPHLGKDRRACKQLFSLNTGAYQWPDPFGNDFWPSLAGQRPRGPQTTFQNVCPYLCMGSRAPGAESRRFPTGPKNHVLKTQVYRVCGQTI